MPHMAVDLDVLDLEVGNRGLEMRIPVDQPLAAIDQPLVVHVDKDLDDRVVEIAFLARRGSGRAGHGEGVARPVAGGAKALELVDDGIAGLTLPFPDLGQKGLAPQLAARGLPVSRQLAFDNHLGGDAGVILARLPQRVKPAHPVPADQDILQRVVEGMPHVQAAGDVGRRDHDAIGLGPRRIRAGHETSGPFPRLVQAAFGRARVECLFHRHRRNPSSGWGIPLAKEASEGKAAGGISLPARRAVPVARV